MSFTLGQQSQKIINQLEETWDHVFLTGNAGTGKSTLLDFFRHSTKKNLAVVAPTGVAAVNIRGETIHSFFQIPPGVTPEQARSEAKRTKRGKIFSALQTLVIDEISMVRADLLDSISVFLQTVRKNKQPFGGVQVIMVGDLHQLPPVVTKQEQEAIDSLYQSPYFFSANVFHSLTDGLYPQIKFFELETIYRQTDLNFIGILNRLRNNALTPEDINILNSRLNQESQWLDDHIYLTAINEQADRINAYKLSEIEGPETAYRGLTTGDFSAKQFPAADLLTIKTGARVMLLNNDPDGRWINGTLGVVMQARSSHVLVRLDNGETEVVEPATWTAYRTRFNPETNSLESIETGSYKQIPLRLAWAITIHKSQGKTFAKVMVDFGRGAFAHGQAYVALSRCTSLSGLKLVRPFSSSSVILDERVLGFLETIRRYRCSL